MSEGSFARVRELFDRAVGLELGEQSRFLDEQCGGDAALRSQLERMLAGHRSSSSFMQKPAGQIDLGDLASDVDPMIGKAFGQYTIRDVLGRGGMGVVYRAEQDRPRRTVALKLIRSSFLAPSLLKRFEHEAQILARLKHPGIAQIYEAGAAPGPDGQAQPFFAMELVRGQSLLEHARASNLSTRERLVLFVRVCEAVQHAHQRGVIHRDLKPGNILVEEEEAERRSDEVKKRRSADELHDRSRTAIPVEPSGTSSLRHSPTSPLGPQPKILDFGVARVTDSDVAATTMQTSIGQVIGTLQYMSPEQAMGQSDRVDVRSDVYSLGVILYELLSGQPPYDVSKRPVTEAARVIAEQDATMLRTVNRSFRGDIETIVQKAMEKEPERRYQSVGDLSADIQRYLGDLPIVARPASTMYQIGKFARRNKALVGGVIATIVVLALGVVGTSAGLLQATKARKLAEDRETIAKTEARKAAKSVEFLVDMLTAADPDQAQGREVTVREILDAASERVAKELADEPEVEMSIRSAIGRTYLGLGLKDKARTHLEAVRDRRALVSGEDSLEYAKSLSLLARLSNAEKDTAGELDFARRALDIRGRLQPASHPDVAEAVVALGQAYVMAGNYVEAVALFRRATTIWESCGEGQRKNLGITLDMLSTALGRVGGEANDKEAVDLATRAVQVMREALGEMHPQVTVVMYNRGFALEQTRDDAQAEAQYRECLEIRRRLYEPAHPRVLSVRNAIAALLIRKGQLDEAQSELEDILRLRKERLGPRHPDVARTIEHLASIAGKRKDVGQQADLLTEAIDIYREQGGVRFAMAAHDLALLCAKQHEAEKAESLFRESLASRRKLGQRTRNIAILLSDFGAFLDTIGKGEEAVGLLHESIGVMDELKMRDRNTCTTLRRLGDAFAHQERLADAEASFRRAFEVAGELKLSNQAAVAHDLAAILSRAGKTDEAEKLNEAWPLPAASPPASK